MRLRLIAPALTIAVLAAACSSSSQPHAPLIGPTTCTATQLEMRLIFIGYATGNVEGIVDVRNKSNRDCDLAGYPAIQLLDATGSPLPTMSHDTTTSFFHPNPVVFVGVTLDAGSDPLSTDAPIAGHGYIDMSWSDGPAPCERPSSFAITPRDAGGSVLVSARPPIASTPAPYICGGGAIDVLPIQPAKGGSVVARPPVSPTPSPLAIPAPVTPFIRCDTPALDMAFFVIGAAGGSVRGVIEVRNRSARSCDLYGYVGLQLRDGLGRPLHTHVKWSTDNFFLTSPAAEMVVGLPPNTSLITGSPVAGHAYIPLGWNEVQPPCVIPWQIEITPPDANSSVFIQTGPVGEQTSICSDGYVVVNPVQPASI
jgi:hypothetical protein